MTGVFWDTAKTKIQIHSSVNDVQNTSVFCGFYEINNNDNNNNNNNKNNNKCYLLTESEVITGKSQTESLMY